MRLIGSEPLDEPWPNEPGYHLISDGSPEGTHLLLDGKSLPGIVGIDWEIERASVSVVTVTVQVAKADVIGERVQWVGLEQVPIEALEAELENRK